MPKTATSYFGSEERKRAETAAFTDVVSGAGHSGSLYRELYDDYEQRESLEARLVKAADVIDLLVQALALERAGARGLEEFWSVVESGDLRLDGPAQTILDTLVAALLAARDAILEKH
jgi:5'-deoxynucleotidase YfbR-like HD superfamily hydrolase